MQKSNRQGVVIQLAVAGFDGGDQDEDHHGEPSHEEDGDQYNPHQDANDQEDEGGREGAGENGVEGPGDVEVEGFFAVRVDAEGIVAFEEPDEKRAQNVSERDAD